MRRVPTRGKLSRPTPAADTGGPSARNRTLVGYGLLAVLAYVPVLLTAPGKVAADTKQYFYLDPGRLLSRAVFMWDPHTSFGTVTHQNIGYLFPAGPYFWLTNEVGIPAWIAQRLWLGSILFGAATGLLYLARTLSLRGPGIVVAALAYMLSPYCLQYASRLSTLLIAWAALPWMVALVARALRDGGWRYPAAFAIVVQLAGSVNATALIFAGIGPVLWIVHEVWIAREVKLREALATVARDRCLVHRRIACGGSRASCVQAAYGLDELKYSETVKAVVDRRSRAGGPARPRLLVLLRRRQAGPVDRQRHRLHAAPMAVSPRATRSRSERCFPPHSFDGSTARTLCCSSSSGSRSRLERTPTRARHPSAPSSKRSPKDRPRASPCAASVAPFHSSGWASLFCSASASISSYRSFEREDGAGWGWWWSRSSVPSSSSICRPSGTGRSTARTSLVPRRSPRTGPRRSARSTPAPTTRGSSSSRDRTSPPTDGGTPSSPSRRGSQIGRTWPASSSRTGPISRPTSLPPSTDGSKTALLDPAAIAPIARLMNAGDVVLRSDLQVDRYDLARPQNVRQLFTPTPTGAAASPPVSATASGHPCRCRCSTSAASPSHRALPTHHPSPSFR